MIPASSFLGPARDLGYRAYTGVPCSYLTPFIDQVITDPNLDFLSAPNEGDAVAVAAGAWLAGQRMVVMMQNSGLGNAVSPLTSLAHVFRIPLLLVVTLRGDPAGTDEPQHALMGAITTRMLDTMEVPWRYFPDRAADVAPALSAAEAHFACRSTPFALVMRKGTVEPAPTVCVAGPSRPRVLPESMTSHGAPATRSEVLRSVVEHTPPGESVVVATTGYTGRELYALGDRANQLYLVGSMGCASAVALGVARARSDLRVVCVDGDGAAIMRLGNFALLGAFGGANLVHLVLDNGVHESTGRQATLSGVVDFAGVAAECGYGRAVGGAGPGDLAALLGAPRPPGPLLVHLPTRAGVPDGLPRPGITPPRVARRLRGHLG